MVTALEGEEGGELNAGGRGKGRKSLGEGRVQRLFRIHELAHRRFSLYLLIPIYNKLNTTFFVPFFLSFFLSLFYAQFFSNLRQMQVLH